MDSTLACRLGTFGAAGGAIALIIAKEVKTGQQSDLASVCSVFDLI
ncbi:hypothetical protein VB712_08285 [Spirulina sp. CCNP1310]|nr:hypothetical protein [Spirulina sp. CCNP1310]MEA5419226.1 hypothetical protein [Spirulina sp. CCNP1310]